jgi:hypothetical protein
VIYCFRNYQHSDNVLLAKFEGFENVGEMKSFCYNNSIDYGEFGNWINTYFMTYNDEWNEEELKALDGEYGIHTKE